MLSTALLIDILAEFLTTLPFVLIYQLMLLKKNDWRVKAFLPHALASCSFVFVLSAIFSLTDPPSIYTYNLMPKVNFVPFDDVSTNLIQYVLNVLLFVPFGFILPITWPQFEKKKCILATGFLFSFAIEFSQLFCHRATDIDDLLMNTLGALLGCLVFTAAKKLAPSIFTFFKSNEINVPKSEFAVLMILAWLSAFFIGSSVSRWMML